MDLIYTALLCESQPFIEYFKLKRYNNNKGYKIYINNSILVAVGGIGKSKIKEILEYLFKRFNIQRAINIGICGSQDRSLKMGELICINHNFNNIKTLSITSVNTPLDNNKLLKTPLVDMEAEFFLQNISLFLQPKDIFIFKIVSDYLDTKILNKTFVSSLIRNNINRLKEILWKA